MDKDKHCCQLAGVCQVPGFFFICVLDYCDLAVMSVQKRRFSFLKDKAKTEKDKERALCLPGNFPGLRKKLREGREREEGEICTVHYAIR